MNWDTVIVGGGSAGCVLANRLSANPGRRVLLLEAGRDLVPGTEPQDILDMYPGRAAFDPANHWPSLSARLNPHSSAPARKYEQARIMGGGSSINGQVANRGTPDDYDDWAALGAVGWDWQGVLPYFCKLEKDLDFAGHHLHGCEGPIAISRIPHERWAGFSHAIEAAMRDEGFDSLPDQNACFGDGYFPMTISNDGRHRVSSAMAYLGSTVRQRPNLEIRANSEVHSLVFDGQAVVGVDVTTGQERLTVLSREVILCAGALHSPALLLRSGIGPQAELQAQRIAVKANLPGVGKNLQEHPGISLSAFLLPAARLTKATRRHIHLGLRYSSGAAGCERSDMYMMAAAKSAWHPLGKQLGTLLSWVNKPYGRGEVKLNSQDPAQSPQVTFNYTGDERDLSRMMDSVRLMARLLAANALSGSIDCMTPSRYSGFAKALGRYSLRNWLLTAPAALLLDSIPPSRRHFMRRFVAGGTTLSALLQDEQALRDYVRNGAFGQWHACGTCRMGVAADPQAVVDPASAKVHGVPGLRVVDASVMPTAPRANLNIPVIMLAERFADAIAV